MNSELRITKSSFLFGRQCRKRFWLHAHGVQEPQMEQALEDRFQAEEAERVEWLAEQLFGGCTRVGGPSPDRKSRTRAAMSLGTVAQAEVVAGDLMAVVDILERRSEGWFVWEVKASTADPQEPKVKPLFEWDLAFQWHVLKAAGIDVRGAGVVMLWKDFVRGGAEPEPSELLMQIDCTDRVLQKLPDVVQQIEDLRAVAAGGEPEEWPRSRCNANRDAANGDRPSDCGHLLKSGRCGASLPVTWAGHLPRLIGKLEARVHEVPNRDLRDLSLEQGEWNWSDAQRLVIEATKSSKVYVDKAALLAGLQDIQWPVAYVDFEFDTQVAIPRFPGYRAYDSIPFQWAMCIHERPEAQLGPTRSFLHEQATDPRQVFAEELLRALPSTGSIVVHHAPAEKTVMKRLAECLGGDVATRLFRVVDRLCDTEKIAKAGYYHPRQLGSWSIKALAPCLTGRGYDDLEIQHGMAAVVGWRRLLNAAPGSPERDELRRRLLEYCGRDAVLMHEVLQKLRSLVGGGDVAG